MGNNLYIGAVNGIVICVDSMDSAGFHGRLYHRYQAEPVLFNSMDSMLMEMERVFDGLNFPRRGDRQRMFIKRNSVQTEYGERLMTDEELLEKHGQQQTFIVRVQHRQNNSWQGQITWAEKNIKLNFRSIWEMVHLMEDAIYEDLPPEERPKTERWNDD